MYITKVVVWTRCGDGFTKTYQLTHSDLCSVISRLFSMDLTMTYTAARVLSGKPVYSAL